MKEFWDQRYAEEGLAYGAEPNAYLQSQLLNFKPGRLLLPGEGEGRNAIFAAKQGWNVTAFDMSETAQKKAVQWADSQGVNIRYDVGNLMEIDYSDAEFDAISLIFLHLPPAVKTEAYRRLNTFLRPGGAVILEAFSQNNLTHLEQNPKIGGPSNPEMLLTTDDIRQLFPQFEIVELAEKIVELNEGKYHVGTGSVVRFTGIKKAS